MSNSVRPQRWQPTRFPCPWDSPGKNTGVGCHFLIHCMKVKRENEVAQSCPTPSDPMDCRLPGSSVHGIFQARVLEWGAIAFSDVCSRFLKRIMPLFPTLVMEKNLITEYSIKYRKFSGNTIKIPRTLQSVLSS